MSFISENLASGASQAREHASDLRHTAEQLLVEITGLCTAIGHSRSLDSAGAAFVNGTAAHGEDFDDTFEGGPVHAGAVIVPAVLAACERHGRDGAAALVGIASGV